MLPLSQAEFTRLLRKENFFSNYKPVKLIPPGIVDSIKRPRGAFVLDIHALKELKLDLCSLIGSFGDEQIEWKDL
ncbi:MAG: hypothetical protein BWY74_01938 [Firmicutes bacterium ADurb.Bin419]|nr:MAG: hypothetical protein BWY74_01938 [Firmicutes bacterium ADurb.Bin419]